jgi:hypothetical protein
VGLGWDVIIRRLNEDERASAAADPEAFAAKLGIEPERRELARWESHGFSGLGALDFLDRLVEEGAVYRGGDFNGYPSSYLAPAGKAGVPLAGLPDDEWVYVEAWDVS